ncbi:MAG: DNA-processing protein DprA [Planctomycetota bacterium]
MMELSPDERALVALHLAPGIGPRTIRGLMERFGSPANILAASIEQLSQVPYVKRDSAAALKLGWTRGDVDAEIATMKRFGVTLLCRGSAGFPRELAEVDGGPLILYVRGAILPADAEAIGLVGSRGCTTYGRRTAFRLAYDLAKAGYTIVSGLARGIDAEAHRGALEAKGRTIAVLANGLSRVYPPEHAELADQVAKSGAVLSEACMNMDPMPGMFPGRNRIISGLSRVVVVVEAGSKSGALITARHAGEQGREVYVVPGNVDSAASAGSLELLRKGAKLVRSAADILEDLRGIAPLFDSAVPVKPKLDPVALRIWELLAEPLSVDDLARLSEIPISQLAGQLMMLELQGVISKLPGNVYERKQ